MKDMKTSKIDMMQLMSDPKNKGKHIIIAAGNVYKAASGKSAEKIVDMIHKKYPRANTEIAYVPKADSLVL